MTKMSQERSVQRIVITQEDIARMIQELEALESTANALRQNLAVLTASITELRTARSLIKKMIDGERIEDAYATIGGGIFVKTKVEDFKKVLVNVGAGYVIELEVDKAIDFVDKRIKELEDTRSRIEARLNEIVRRAENIRQFLAYIYSLMREERKAETKESSGT